MRLGSPQMDALLLALAVAQMALLPLALLWVWRATRQVDVRAHVQAVEAAMSQALAELRVAQEGHGARLRKCPMARSLPICGWSWLRSRASRSWCSTRHAARAQQRGAWRIFC